MKIYGTPEALEIVQKLVLRDLNTAVEARGSQEQALSQASGLDLEYMLSAIPMFAGNAAALRSSAGYRSVPATLARSATQRTDRGAVARRNLLKAASDRRAGDLSPGVPAEWCVLRRVDAWPDRAGGPTSRIRQRPRYEPGSHRWGSATANSERFSEGEWHPLLAPVYWGVLLHSQRVRISTCGPLCLHTN